MLMEAGVTEATVKDHLNYKGPDTLTQQVCSQIVNTYMYIGCSAQQNTCTYLETNQQSYRKGVIHIITCF